MKPSLLPRQWHAVIIGLVWPFAYLWINAMTLGSILGNGHGWSNVAAQIVSVIGIPLLVAYYVAVVSGPFDLLALVTMLIPAAGFCVMFTYIGWQQHSSESGLQLRIYLQFVLLPCICSFIFAAIGIGLKRLHSRSEPLDQDLTRVFRAYLKWDLGILGAIMGLAVVTNAVQLIYADPLGVHGLFLNTRERFVLKEKHILESPTTTENEKLGALFSTQWDKPELSIIRNALKDQSAQVRFFAAVLLLEQRDGSGLIELEPSLMHSAKIRVYDYDSFNFGQTMDYDASLNLEHITDTNAAPILTRLQLSDDVEVRNEARLGLSRMGLAK